MDLAEMIAAHQTSLYAFLYRMTGNRFTAEDLMQETFVRAFRAGQRYRPEGRLSSWLLSIAANLVKDYWRSQKGHCLLPLDAADMRPSTDSPEDEVLASHEAGRLRAALLSLPIEQRAPIVLFYYHDLSYEEIARCLVIPTGTVRSRIHNGKERIRQILEGRASTI